MVGRGGLVLRVLLAVVGLGLGIGGVMALREATLSTHYHVDKSTEAVVILHARIKGEEPGQTRTEAVQAKVAMCRLEVGRSDPTSIEDQGGGRYRVVLTPGMDETNQRQLRGCLQDWNADHLRIDVLSLEVR